MDKRNTTRRRGAFEDMHGSGRMGGHSRADASVPRANNNLSRAAAQRDRMRTQQQCRDYWQRTYGPEAEMLSRGGVSWLR